MNAKRLITSFAFLAATGIVPTAFAQTASNTGFAVNRFEPSERGSEWFALESLDFRGKARPAVGIVADYQYRPLVIYGSDGEVKRSVVRNVLTTNVGASFVLAERLRISANLPIVVFQDGHSGTLGGQVYAAPKNQQAIGDLRFGLDLRLLGKYQGPFSLAVGAQLWAPTGSKADYTSDGKIRIAPRLLVAGEVGAFAYAARASYIYRGTDAANYANGPLGSELGYAASVGFRVADKKLVVGPEIFGSTVVTSKDPVDLFAKKTSPLEGIIGAHYTLPGDFRIGGGVGTGLTRGYGSPEVRALLNLEFAPQVNGVVAIADRDGDGISDKLDACADIPGVANSDPAKNGCPPDTDGDGVYDKDDACMSVPGVATNDPATNGCPADKDGDKIYDKDDACVDVPGVASADPKKNGCPADTDGDGILDKEDACVDKPGIKTNDPKTNGCPDPDRDKDGIANDTDACPDEAGKADKDPKRNGCPKAFVVGNQIKILDQVKFKTGSAVIEKSDLGEGVVNAVIDVLKKHTDIKHLRIEGHTDNKGVPANNKKLSQQRAQAVVDFMVKAGFAKDMFVANGFGQEKPIDDNKTEQGRTNNRRVEFHIMTDDEAKGFAPAAAVKPTKVAPPAKPKK
jgi:outer membrane protein OmpA-like peptidoglycan-associated protein